MYIGCEPGLSGSRHAMFSPCFLFDVKLNQPNHVLNRCTLFPGPVTFFSRSLSLGPFGQVNKSSFTMEDNSNYKPMPELTQFG